jgi:hypothetical protein
MPKNVINSENAPEDGMAKIHLDHVPLTNFPGIIKLAISPACDACIAYKINQDIVRLSKRQVCENAHAENGNIDMTAANHSE